MNINEDLKHEIVLRIDLCAECDFDKETANINNLIISFLQQKGIDIKAEFVKSYGSINELMIHLIKHDGSKVFIYSNNKMHEKQGAIYSHTLTSEVAKQIVSRILKEK